ncbi:cellulose synthase/poly-beta-1,6-N-acetylglucosamine synthase-like glycosyltransferase [Ochrobactrum daejeonense]|uniref:Cellulose synthase/poly-beta-1,6-N-acetylglucosamine synthase-like glycosyltransferase n=1 Tax=Brucella daejeonensis TaxID=659015 RepID=A0A7W9ELN5_9HYPH|nr:glycosyltransferase family 2 protein [Brucella daejeonensis]MBB5701205.1 cellulose synthase/poly-beta-1,6-N-acetylglucosamine synthase-like glycosyltransferase [Brucella daejeonensis]
MNVPKISSGANSGGPLLAPLFTGRKRVEYVAGIVLWAVAIAYFWQWWFISAGHNHLAGAILVTALLAWITLLPVYFIVVFFHAARPTGPLRIPAGSRVAMVVTKAPSEPFEVVAETLCAMLAQNVPHDTWLADEDPSPATLAWCREHGVFVSTRKGRADYHRQTWPRRTRCKEGNLAFFYDHYGYERYDFVSQLDADHVPEPGYLYNMLRPFADPVVGYVSAPSICDRNARESWSARGRLYVEASMHGSLQAGYNGGFAPVCIGSHYAVRTAALKEIGGLGPELAEDHSTTLFMNAHGWRGVHALDAIAHGDGPRTFADLVTQEFQWSRSLVMILLQYTPKLIGRLPLRLKIQFLFSQLWYPLYAFFLAMTFVLPIAILLYGDNFVSVTYPDFLTHFLPQSLVILVLAFWWRSSGTFRPIDGRIFSWEAMLFLLARWPWVLAGTFAAFRDWLTGSFVDFRVTPKGSSEVDPVPFRVIAPYALVSGLSLLPVLFVEGADQTRGFFVFAILNACFYLFLMAMIIIQHARENRVRMTGRFYRPVMACSFSALVAMTGFTTMERGRDGIEALSWGTRSFSLFDDRFSVAGAGIGGRDVHMTIFNPRWRTDAARDAN